MVHLTSIFKAWSLGILLLHNDEHILTHASNDAGDDSTPVALRRTLKFEQQKGFRDKKESNEGLSVMDILRETPILSEMKTMMQVAEVAPYISQNTSYTLLAPYSYAWETTDKRLMAKLSDPSRAWRVHLQNLLLYHIIEDNIWPESIKARQEKVTMNGNYVTFTRKAGTKRRIHVNHVLVLADCAASNGHEYMLDRVLRPTWFDTTLMDIAATRFTEFAAAIMKTELDEWLQNTDVSYTVFAPTNDAFYNAFYDIPLDTAELQNLLLSHIVLGLPIPSSQFTSRSVESSFGTRLYLHPGNPPTIEGLVNDARIIEMDGLANNGLVHAIDTVLLLQESPPCNFCSVEINLSCVMSTYFDTPCHHFFVRDWSCGEESVNTASFNGLAMDYH